MIKLKVIKLKVIKLRLISFVFSLITVIFMVSVPANASVDTTRWQKYSLISAGDTEKGYALVELTPPIYHSSSPNLGDLRIVRLEGSKNEEVPYDIVDLNVPIQVARPGELINRGTQGSTTTATVFLGKRQIHNHLVIHTTDTDFIKEVTIEGSDDRTNWIKLDSPGKIADFSNSGEGFSKRDLIYNPVDYPYIRVTLTGAGKPVKIDGVDILFETGGAKTERELLLKTERREYLPKEQSDVITVSSSYNNLLIDRLLFNIDCADFSRWVTVYGGNTTKEWFPVGEGKLESFKQSSYVKTEFSLPVNSQGYRYLKVVIRNGDSPPLKISSVRAVFTPRYLLFPYKKGGEYRIYLTNPVAKVPEYDIRGFSLKILETNPPIWTISDPKSNPHFKPAVKAIPESEKHKWLLPSVLALLVAGLAVIIMKVMPGVNKDQ